MNSNNKKKYIIKNVLPETLSNCFNINVHNSPI